MQNSNQSKMFRAIRRWQLSGLSQKAWCEKNELAYSSFHYWYKQYRSQLPDSGPDTPEGFVQLVTEDNIGGGSWCTLTFANGSTLNFHQPVGPEVLKALIH